MSGSMYLYSRLVISMPPTDIQQAAVGNLQPWIHDIIDPEAFECRREELQRFGGIEVDDDVVLKSFVSWQ